MHKLPPQRELLRAFTERDSTYDGVFFTGVKTTGIFCRPVCTARKPKPENIEFFPTGKEALFASYRPCLRCRPLDGAERPSPTVERLLAAIENNPSGRIRDADLAALGLDASTARRQFKKQFGMTFQAYHRARRMGGALQAVRNGARVIDSQLDAGFASGSGFRDAFQRLFGAAPGRRKHAAVLIARWIDTPLGAMLALADDHGMHVFDFVDRRGLERHLERLVRRQLPRDPDSLPSRYWQRWIAHRLWRRVGAQAMAAEPRKGSLSPVMIRWTTLSCTTEIQSTLKVR